MVMEKLELEPFVARDTPERLLRIVGVVTKTELHPRPGAMAERHPNPYTDLALELIRNLLDQSSSSSKLSMLTMAPSDSARSSCSRVLCGPL